MVLPESDMNEEMSTEIQELVVGLLEKHPFGLAAKGNKGADSGRITIFLQRNIWSIK